MVLQPFGDNILADFAFPDYDPDFGLPPDLLAKLKENEELADLEDNRRAAEELEDYNPLVKRDNLLEDPEIEAALSPSRTQPIAAETSRDSLLHDTISYKSKKISVPYPLFVRPSTDVLPTADSATDLEKADSIIPDQQEQDIDELEPDDDEDDFTDTDMQELLESMSPEEIATVRDYIESELSDNPLETSPDAEAIDKLAWRLEQQFDTEVRVTYVSVHEQLTYSLH